MRIKIKSKEEIKDVSINKENLKANQVFTPPWVTNEMLDLLYKDRPTLLSDWETFIFEPSCGDGEMLIVIIERIYKALLEKYNDPERSFCETLFKFYAIELDEELVPKARMRIYEWAQKTACRELTRIEEWLIAFQLHQSIEYRDALKEGIASVHQTPAIRALKRKNIKSAR